MRIETWLEKNWCRLLWLTVLLAAAPLLVILLLGGDDGRPFFDASTPRVTEYAIPENPTCPAVDLVYLWVNGSDPLIALDIARATGKPYVESGRLRDVPTLRYSIRAADTFAPWIRRVVLVTNGQVPGWLNASNPRVRVVAHAEIFANRSHLPTFNSNAIESQLSRVPGVAPCWLYMNDDFSFARPASLRDFLDVKTGRQLLAFDSWQAPEFEHMKRNIWHRSVGRSNRLFNSWYHPGVDPDSIHHNYEGHNTRLFQHAILEKMYERWRPEFERTASHRFRDGEDVALPFLYNNVVLEEFGGISSSKLSRSFSYATFTNDAASVRRTLQRFKDNSPLSFCLNDGAGTVSTQADREKYDKAVAALVEFFEDWFPLPSDLEKVSPGTRTISRSPPLQPRNSTTASSHADHPPKKMEKDGDASPMPTVLRLLVIAWIIAACWLTWCLVSDCFSREKIVTSLDGERDLAV